MRLFKLIALVGLTLGAFSVWAGTTGNIRGDVTDLKTKEPLGGVMVVATSPVLQGEQTAMSDEKGLYVLTNLPAGTYKLTAIFGEAKTEREGIEVTIDKTLGINMQISLNNAAGEVYTITEKAPNIDVASATVGLTVTKDYLQNVPLGGGDRNFSGAMSVLPSASGDTFGTSVGGASSPENTYVIDGLNTTDPSSGLMGTRLVMEFMDEFAVYEGGYGPEFGRATGGFVNAITKGGSNEFHGSVFSYFTPGSLQATPQLVSRASDSLVRRGKTNYYMNLGFEVGGPVVKDKLWFHLGYAPELQQDYWIREIHPVMADSSKPTMPKKDNFQNLVMGDSVQKDTYQGMAQTHQYTLKLTHLIDDNNRHSLGVRGSPTLFNGAVANPFDSDTPSSSINGGPETFHYTQTGGNVASGIYNYAGKYFNDKLKLDAYIGLHHQRNKWGPLLSSADDARMSYMYGNLNLPDVWDGAPDACRGAPFGDGTVRCPTRNYSRYGFGSVNDFQMYRLSQKVMLTNLFELVGLHQLKYGIDLEQLRSYRQHGNTGASGHKGSYMYYGGEADPFFKGQQYTIHANGESKITDQIQSVAQTLNWGAFIGDSWNPIPSLTVNYGLRWEGQDFFGVKSPTENTVLAHKFDILNNWAPRAGIVWDYMRNGKGALRFNYGRFFESVPMDVNGRAFGGEGRRIAFWKCTGKKPLDVKNPDIECAQDLDKARTRYLAGEDSIVAPGMKGQYSDEYVTSFDIEPFPSWVLGVTGVYRNLGRIIEDMSTDGGSTYLFANPGENFDTSDLVKQAAATTNKDEKAKLDNMIKVLSRIKEFPKAKRDIFQIQFKVDKKISDHFLLLATYNLSWIYGNYPGLFSSNNGQLDPNLTSQFDLPQLLVNRMGYLPQDGRHKIKLSGFYKASLRDFGISSPYFFSLGLSARTQSGVPYEVLGADDIYGSDEVFMLPRGAGGRTPWTWAMDLNVNVGCHVSEEVTAELFASMFNLTNNRARVSFDDTYTYDTVKPISGGDFSQLKHAVNINGNPVKVNPNFGNTSYFQAPFSAQVGFRVKF